MTKKLQIDYIKYVDNVIIFKDVRKKDELMKKRI